MTLDIEQLKADLAAGRTDTRRIEKLIAEVEWLQTANERLTAELDALRAGLDDLLEKLRDDEAAEVVRVTGRSLWPGEG